MILSDLNLEMAVATIGGGKREIVAFFLRVTPLMLFWNMKEL